MQIGVLSLQGNFAMHIACLTKLKVNVVEVRTSKDLAKLNGLIIPGGESTTILKLLEQDKRWLPALQEFFQAKKPIFGTCAGIILLATEVIPQQYCLKFLDVTIARNAYGSQLDSHMVEATLELDGHSQKVTLPLIRAPKITRVGKEVRILAHAGEDILIVEQDHVMGATCHPEAVTTIVHEYFIKKCLRAQAL
jgi:pyridoxal 5'-phosphate synthase pdxT subunit